MTTYIEPYFKRDPYIDSDGIDYIGKTTYDSKTMYWFVWTLSDILMAIIDNGMKVRHFSEYPDDISTQHGKNQVIGLAIPLSYILIAEKEEEVIPMGNLITAIHKATHYMSHDLFGGPRILSFSWVINFQKGMTLFWVLGLMLYFENFSMQAWVYLALHGSYGIIWLLKDLIFPDSRWQKKITFGGALTAIVAVLGPYWVAPYLLISPVLGESHVGATMIWMALAIIAYALGLMLMLVADAQKFYTLKYHKGLITTGLFRFIRHPNYLGEMLIYGAFAIVTWHWIPWVLLAWVWLGYFSINIIMKERSMSRHETWAEYKKHSWYLIPFIF